MDPIEQLKDDVLNGRIDANRLVDLLAIVQRELQAAKQRIADLEQRNAELEKQLAAAGTAKLDEPFSMRAEEKRQQARGKKRRQRKDNRRRGRVRTADKIAQAERTEEVYPDDVGLRLANTEQSAGWRRGVGQAERTDGLSFGKHVQPTRCRPAPPRTEFTATLQAQYPGRFRMEIDKRYEL